jgi:hypothetical protein
LAKVAIFTTNVDAENQTLINHKSVCGALNRHFCQTRVIASVFFFVRWFVGRFGRAVGQTHSLPSFGLRVGWCDLAMCVAVKRWHLCQFIFSVVSVYVVQLELSLVLVLVHQDFFLVSVMVLTFCEV